MFSLGRAAYGSGMLVRVTCAGVLIGTARFDPPEGLAHASLVPSAGFGLVSSVAWVLGRQFAATQFWASGDDFAAAAAGRWTSGRLALEDTLGRELAVDNVLVLAGFPGGADGPLIHVVADFRADTARVEAYRTRLDTGGGDRSAA